MGFAKHQGITEIIAIKWCQILFENPFVLGYQNWDLTTTDQLLRYSLTTCPSGSGTSYDPWSPIVEKIRFRNYLLSCPYLLSSILLVHFTMSKLFYPPQVSCPWFANSLHKTLLRRWLVHRMVWPTTPITLCRHPIQSSRKYRPLRNQILSPPVLAMCSYLLTNLNPS